jgi:hypothetical protein
MAIAALGVYVDNLPGTANPEDDFAAIAAKPTELDSARFNKNQAIRRMALQEERFVRGKRKLPGRRKNFATRAG